VSGSQQPTSQLPSGQQGWPGAPQVSHIQLWQTTWSPTQLPRSQQRSPSDPHA
jgi:hypothetical protein